MFVIASLPSRFVLATYVHWASVGSARLPGRACNGPADSRLGRLSPLAECRPAELKPLTGTGTPA